MVLFPERKPPAQLGPEALVVPDFHAPFLVDCKPSVVVAVDTEVQLAVELHVGLGFGCGPRRGTWEVDRRLREPGVFVPRGFVFVLGVGEMVVGLSVGELCCFDNWLGVFWDPSLRLF